jgi:hypothetical protein
MSKVEDQNGIYYLNLLFFILFLTSTTLKKTTKHKFNAYLVRADFKSITRQTELFLLSFFIPDLSVNLMLPCFARAFYSTLFFFFFFFFFTVI